MAVHLEAAQNLTGCFRQLKNRTRLVSRYDSKRLTR